MPEIYWRESLIRLQIQCKTVDLVYTKYMKARIAYEGVQRIEQFMFHKDAFREVIYEAFFTALQSEVG